jgi:hypothetical protein
VRLTRGRRTIATLGPDEVQALRISRSASALGYYAGKNLFLYSSSRPHVRLSKDLPNSAARLIPRFVHHGNLFRFCRDEARLSVDEEMRLSEFVTAQMSELALNALRELPSTLTILYFSLVDELCHVYLDQIEALWPEGRGADLLRRSFGLLDACIGKIMDRLDANTLLVLSSDHGQAPYRRVLHINELLAENGLVRRPHSRANRGYDLRRSVAYYHPADCGQVVVNPSQARRTGLSLEQIGQRVLRCVEEANSSLGAGISHLWGEEADPYLLFLYPCSDTHLTGRYHPEAQVLDAARKGGQHLSPLCPTPWMQAMLALWSPLGLSFHGPSIPKRNTDVKAFLLRYLYPATS